MKTVLIITFSILSYTKTFACSTCGCSSYNAFMGISNYRFTDYIGLSWNYYAFSEEAESNVKYMSSYHKLELKGAWAFGKRWQALITLPYINNNYEVRSEEEPDNRVFNFTGIGDLSIGAQYILYSNTDSIMKKTKHFLIASAGTELPSGKFNRDFRTEKIPPALSTGSGGIDFFAGLQYTIATMKWNIRTAYQFKLNTQNTTGYNFGEQQSAEIYAARKFNLKQLMLLPYAGVAAEQISADKYYEVQMEGTGSVNYSLNAGMEFNFQKLNLGGYIAMPVKNTIGDDHLFNVVKFQAYASLTL